MEFLCESSFKIIQKLFGTVIQKFHALSTRELPYPYFIDFSKKIMIA